MFFFGQCSIEVLLLILAAFRDYDPKGKDFFNKFLIRILVLKRRLMWTCVQGWFSVGCSDLHTQKRHNCFVYVWRQDTIFDRRSIGRMHQIIVRKTLPPPLNVIVFACLPPFFFKFSLIFLIRLDSKLLDPNSKTTTQ